jgi:alanyl-tRNA synthetase
MAEGPLDAIRKTSGGTEFLGYDVTEAEGEIVGIIAEKRLVEELTEVGHDSPVGVVLDRTPFYGESGGQVGDVGTITGPGFEFQVFDTKKDGELVLHIGHLKSGSLKLNVKVKAQVDADRRAGIRRAHSATHLLHHALHQTVGEKATQRGSKVENDRLRFDFAHNRALTRQELEQVEDIINSRIAEGTPIGTAVMDLNEAKKLGAMALFGEKYGDRVRVVTMGEYSREFCGGTHLTNTGQVGLCKIISEEPVAKGVRRIEALNGKQALSKIRPGQRPRLGRLRSRVASVPRGRHRSRARAGDQPPHRVIHLHRDATGEGDRRGHQDRPRDHDPLGHRQRARVHRVVDHLDRDGHRRRHPARRR